MQPWDICCCFECQMNVIPVYMYVPLLGILGHLAREAAAAAQKRPVSQGSAAHILYHFSHNNMYLYLAYSYFVSLFHTVSHIESMPTVHSLSNGTAQ